MTEKASRRGAVELGTVLMIAAFAVVGGFMYWLTGQAAEERALGLVEDTTSVMVDEYATAIPISASDIMLDASPYAGQLVRLAPQNVSSLLGQQGFWLDLPSGPFLVSFSDELRVAGTGVTAESTVRVTATVTLLTNETVGEWFDAGRLSDGERLAAEFAVGAYFLEAVDIEVSSDAPAGGA